MPYRPDIDGLRALAVLAVVLYHYGLGDVSGGFVGVDVFFVISGFLITGVLRRDIEVRGLSLVDFYHRRIRRIIPALLFMLVVALMAGYVLLMPGDYADLGESGLSAAAGAGNLHFFWNTGYFDRASDLLPLLHTWSLGVEEQFYLVWPFALALLLKVGQGRSRFPVAAIAALAAASFAFGIHAMAADPKAAFYLPQFRAWELMIGAALAFLPPVRMAFLAHGGGILGLAVITWSVLALTSESAFPGWNALPPVAGAALLIWSGPDHVVGRGLAMAPLRHVGLVSYSLYLWHWPLLVFFRHYASGEAPTTRESVVLALMAGVISWLSWRFVERPFRTARVRPGIRYVTELRRSRSGWPSGHRYARRMAYRRDSVATSRR
ncbi:MAG: acyltransferase [Acidobacteria bacterium]|nr:acyltransferase [Acidobacteriota bacterium]